MKKLSKIIFIMSCISLLLCACNNTQREGDEPVTETGEEITEETTAYTEEDAAADEYNLPIIAKALGVDENGDKRRRLDSILSTLRYIKAGKLQKAESSEESNLIKLAIVSEKGTNFSVYLENSLGLNSVQNDDTGEWVITSEQ